MSTAAKMSLADIALALRDEQIEAKVVHYKAELQTSPELDLVTARVVEELRALQASKRPSGGRGSATTATGARDRAEVETELIQHLKEMLARIFKPGKLATFCQRKLAESQKRFARVFFESELHEKIRGSAGETKTMRFAEQGLYHVLARNQDYIVSQLDAFEFARPETKERSRELFLEMVKELRNDFLSRTTPELNELVRFLTEVLTSFFTRELPPMIGELAWEVVKDARLADARTSAGAYKIDSGAFDPFRHAFERRFLQRLVPFTADEMLKRVRASQTPFREETLRFVADPHIFSEVCEIICDAIYDMLYNDGFLDLPSDWRARLQGAGG